MPHKHVSPLAVYVATMLALSVGVALFVCRTHDRSALAVADSGQNREELLADIATVQTPEQTHKLFIDALARNDIDGAVACCVAKNQQHILKEVIYGALQKGVYETMIKDISSIASSSASGIRAVYSYQSLTGEGALENAELVFLKNSKGIWLVSSL